MGAQLKSYLIFSEEVPNRDVFKMCAWLKSYVTFLLGHEKCKATPNYVAIQESNRTINVSRVVITKLL